MRESVVNRSPFVEIYICEEILSGIVRDART